MARCLPDGEYRTHLTISPHLIGFPCCRHVFVFHSFVVWSHEPLASTEPSGEKSSDKIQLVWAFMGFVRNSPLSSRQAIISPRPPLAINSPSRDTATAHVPSVC